MFNPEHLRTLRAVVEEGTVLAAADQLSLTPSAVSQQLARLQKQVGQPILVRRGRNVVPTDAAAVLVRIGAQIQELDERARAELDRLTRTVAGRVVVGGFPTAVRAVISVASRVLAERHPDLELTIHETESEDALELVRLRRLDVAVVHDWTDHHLHVPDELISHAIGEDVVDLIAPADHDLPVRADGTVALRDLEGQTWLDDTPGVYSDWLLAALREAGLSYRIGAVGDNYGAKIALAAAGFGITLLPRLGREEHPEGVVTLALHDPPTRRLFAVQRRAAERRPAVEAVLAAVREAWAALPG